MRPLPSWSLSEPFCSTSWSMAFYSSSSTHILLLAILQQWSLISSLWLVWHISSYCQVQVSKARLVFEELMYWFVKTRVICSSTGLWRQYPLVEEIIYIDKFKSCTTLTTSLILDLGCIFFLFLFSLVLSVNSPNATTLHSRCIWEGVLEYIYVSRVV